MKIYAILGIAACGLLSGPALSFSQDQPVTGEKSVAFPPSTNCSTNSPCRNVTGEILRIEESYWIKSPEGAETHMKVTRDTKMEDVPKVGDKIAAQVTSKGEANSVVKLAELPIPQTLPVPSHAQKDLRESSSKQGQSQSGQSAPGSGESSQRLDPLSGGGNIDPSSKMNQRPTQ